MVNLTEVLKEVQGLKNQIGSLKKDLVNKVLEVHYKDLITIKINGRQEILNFSINPKTIDQIKKEELEEICKNAVNLAIKKSQDMIYKMNNLSLNDETT